MSDAADIAQITEGLTKAIGANSGLNSTLKFDFEGKGFVFVDGKATPNSVSTRCQFRFEREQAGGLHDHGVAGHVQEDGRARARRHCRVHAGQA